MNMVGPPLHKVKKLNPRTALHIPREIMFGYVKLGVSDYAASAAILPRARLRPLQN